MKRWSFVIASALVVHLTTAGWARFARPFGLVVARDGSMLMGDEQNGIIYPISYGP
jgi:hypothetical protein